MSTTNFAFFLGSYNGAVRIAQTPFLSVFLSCFYAEVSALNVLPGIL